MMKRQTRWGIGVALGLSLGVGGWSTYVRLFPHRDFLPAPKEKGQRVPLFSGRTLDGHRFHFIPTQSDHNLLIFWASWCAPCAQETPSLVAMAKRNSDWKITAISNDSDQKEVLNFLKIFPGLRAPNISLIWDSDEEIANQFGLTGLPESFLVDRNGLLIQKFVGTVDWDRF